MGAPQACQACIVANRQDGHIRRRNTPEPSAAAIESTHTRCQRAQFSAPPPARSRRDRPTASDISRTLDSLLHDIEIGQLPAMAVYKPAARFNQHPSYTATLERSLPHRQRRGSQWERKQVVTMYDETAVAGMAALEGLCPWPTHKSVRYRRKTRARNRPRSRGLWQNAVGGNFVHSEDASRRRRVQVSNEAKSGLLQRYLNERYQSVQPASGQTSSATSRTCSSRSMHATNRSAAAGARGSAAAAQLL